MLFLICLCMVSGSRGQPAAWPDRGVLPALAMFLPPRPASLQRGHLEAPGGFMKMLNVTKSPLSSAVFYLMVII